LSLYVRKDLEEVGWGEVERITWQRRGKVCGICGTVTNCPVSKSAEIG